MHFCPALEIWLSSSVAHPFSYHRSLLFGVFFRSVPFSVRTRSSPDHLGLRNLTVMVGNNWKLYGAQQHAAIIHHYIPVLALLKINANRKNSTCAYLGSG